MHAVWHDERHERTVMGSARDKDSDDASGTLPPIATSHVLVPTPMPPMATKSKLKPPSQRTAFLSNKTVAGSDSGSPSPLKLPTLVKPVAKAVEAPVSRGNQETELDTSSRTGGPRGSAVDKHRDFIRDLEDQKRKEKEAQSKQDARRRKLQKQLTDKILTEAALARQKPEPEATTATDEQPECHDTSTVEDDDKREREKEAKRQRKRLLTKQQALLETLQTKQREKQEEEEHEKARERRRQHKLKKAVLDAIHASHVDDDDEPEVKVQQDDEQAVVSPVKGTPEEMEVDNQPPPDKPKKHHKKKHHVATTVARESCPTDSRDDAAEAAPTLEDDGSPSDKPKKEKNDAIHKKQQEYLAKLAEQRRLKQKEDEDAKLAQEKRRKRVQLEAQQRLQEAAAKLQQQRQLEEQAAAENEPEEEKKVVVNVNAMVARLSKLKDKDAQVIPEARDFASWKKRHGVRSDQKVFSVTGWYPVIRESLEARGWFCNEERGSPFFDLKWSLKSDDLKTTKLKEEQFVNHFFANTAITTKVGLLHTLRNLPWHQSVDVDAVFPRAYDLNEPCDMDAFIMDFRYTFAEGVLKRVVQGINNAKKSSVRLNEAFVAVLLSIGRKKLRAKRQQNASPEALDESVDDTLDGGAEDLVSDLEWEVLTKHQVDAPGKFRASLAYKKKVVVDAERDPALEQTPVPVVDTVVSAHEKKQQRQLEKLRIDAFNRDKATLSDRLARVSVLSAASCDELVRLTEALKEACPQFTLNGSPCRNVWIVKPAGLSRGRGIRVFDDLTALLAYADVENHKECQWVAQKYIENPLLICDRKFDIRQWVLVTSWDPLTVWMYDDFYLRFSSEPYSMEDLSDQYVHLTNNSIQKYSDKFNDAYATADGSIHVEGNMLHSDEFKEHLERTRGVDNATFERELHDRMKEIVVQSLTCAQDQVQHRKNACELYGYDFMIDETLRPWLIEVNSSPACDYSTPTAQRYVETGLRGIVQVIVDHREYEARKKVNGGSSSDPEPSTGRWCRIHKGEFVGKPVAAFGADFQVKGTKVQRSRGKSKAANVNVAVAEKVPDEEPLDEPQDDPQEDPENPEDQILDTRPETIIEGQAEDERDFDDDEDDDDEEEEDRASMDSLL